MICMTKDEVSTAISALCLDSPIFNRFTTSTVQLFHLTTCNLKNYQQRSKAPSTGWKQKMYRILNLNKIVSMYHRHDCITPSQRA